MMKAASALIAGLALLAASCGRAHGGEATVTIATGAGEVTLAVALAQTPEERRRGLMGRTSLPERSGMLFLFPEASHDRFWMKDTLIPLSIAFVDASGRILAILDMDPCRADPCRVYDAGVSYRSALEVNQGVFSRLGVRVGDVMMVEP